MNWQNVTVKLSDLQPWEHNPRTMTKKQAQRLLKSWKDLGQFQTIAIGPRENGSGCPVYDGHQRLSALLAAYGAQYAIDARQSDRALTEDERRYLITQANLPVGAWRFEEIAGWPEAQEWGFDAEMLQTWNSDAAALATMLEAEQPTGDADAEPQIDRAEELNEKWRVQRGDLWRIGAHRLLCGDSTRREDVERVMQGEKADCAATDIPYEMTPKEWDKLPELPTLFSMIDDSSKYDAAFITTSVNPLTAKLISIDPGRYCHSWVWNKKLAGNFMTAEHRPMMIHEDITVFCRGELNYKPVMVKGVKRIKGGNGSSRLWEMELTSKVNDEYYPTSIIEIGNTDRSDIVHPTEKPEPLYRYLLEMYSDIDQIVSDFFAGSGTTLVACQNLQRKCRAIEISPNYCAVILERMVTAFPGIEIERLEEGSNGAA